jgi:hypothetical protein
MGRQRVEVVSVGAENRLQRMGFKGTCVVQQEGVCAHGFIFIGFTAVTHFMRLS